MSAVIKWVWTTAVVFPQGAEMISVCASETCTQNKPLALLDSVCCWNGVYRTPDQLSSILVVWKTQADQNLELFLFLKQNAPYLWLVRSKHLQVQPQAWCVRKGDKVCVQSHPNIRKLTLTTDETHRCYGPKLGTRRALSLIPYPASCTTSHLNTKILRGFKT
jgi:hypothetical protein